MNDEVSLQQRYQAALAGLTEQLQADRYALALILCGSLSHDEVWAKSDLDLIVVTTEDLKANQNITMDADGINAHVIVMPRAKFKADMQSATQSSFLHSFLSKSTLIFARDETIADLYHNIKQVGTLDRKVQRLRLATYLLGSLTKAEKWFHVKRDYRYCFVWLIRCIEGLAGLEVVGQGEVTGREVVQQALRHNPAFFHAVYTDLIDGPKNEATLGAALDSVRGYLLERQDVFQPVFDLLRESSGPRSTTEINHYFEKHFGLEGIGLVCEWLADENLLTRVSLPARLTPKSTVTIDEAAYLVEE